MRTILKFIAASAMGLASWSAWAQPAGTWLGRLGVTQIAPQVQSGDMTPPSFPHSQIDVGSDTQLGIGVTYMFTDHLSVDVPLALPFQHKIYGAGALAGAGQIGSTRALPFTVFGQYRFKAATAVFRPYVGLGLTYAYFYDEAGSSALTAMTNPGGPVTTLRIDSKWALTPQLGFSYVLNDRWLLDASFSQTYLRTRTALSTGQTIDATLNPHTFSVGLGMKF